MIRSGVVQYLELSGYEAKGYALIADARRAVEEKLPDLIIQDVMIPDGDGFMFIKELKHSYPRLPVIFMTARVEESDRILGFELGCDDYITKPFSPKELVLRVAALFRRDAVQVLKFPDIVCTHPAVLPCGRIAVHAALEIATKQPVHIELDEVCGLFRLGEERS